MEAHNGLSAKIVEESGFAGIWASGLSISASYGVRDCNEASWTQVVETVEFMADCTNIPILMDADNGFGDYNNLRTLVKKLNKINISGVCIEDKLFPKRNSLIDGVTHNLESIGDFCGKIKAAKDTQKQSDFCVIARTEAFISSRGTEEALRRADAYAEAGADGILVHSKLNNPSEVIDFMKHWKSNVPILIVPTTYYDTPVDVFEKLGVSMAIWANHNLRASILAMKEVSKQIYSSSSISALESKVSTLEEVFKLTDMDELINSKKKYAHTS